MIEQKTSKVAQGPAKMGVVRARAKDPNAQGVIKPIIPPVVNKQPLKVNKKA